MKIFARTDIISVAVAIFGLTATVSLQTAVENVLSWLFVAQLMAFCLFIASLTVFLITRWRRAKQIPTLKAYAYLDPPDQNACFLKWDAPNDVNELSLVLDVKPVRQPKFRQRLLADPALAPGESVKTELFSRRNGSWRWATTEGGIMHEDPMTCCVIVMSKGKHVANWRFAIPGRQYPDTPQLVGDNLFNAPLD